jgi:hypothetical protein
MPQVWRVSLLGRVGTALLIPVYALVFLTIRPVVALLGAAFAVLAWVVFAWRPSITLTDTEVVVRNPFLFQRIALKDVARVGPGYGGLVITTRGGARTSAWAVQKSNLATWTGRRTRADEVAEAIIAAAKLEEQSPA